MNVNDSPALLGASSVASMLDCSVQQVYQMSARGDMPAPINVGVFRYLRWRRDIISQWITDGCPQGKTDHQVDGQKGCNDMSENLNKVHDGVVAFANWGRDDLPGNGSTISPGAHPARLTGCEIIMSKDLRPVVALTFEIVEGEHAGQRITNYIGLTEDAKSRVEQDFATIGIANPLQELELQLVTDECFLLQVVSQLTDDGSVCSRISFLNAIEESSVSPDIAVQGSDDEMPIADEPRVFDQDATKINSSSLPRGENGKERA